MTAAAPAEFELEPWASATFVDEYGSDPSGAAIPIELHQPQRGAVSLEVLDRPNAGPAPATLARCVAAELASDLAAVTPEYCRWLARCAARLNIPALAQDEAA